MKYSLWKWLWHVTGKQKIYIALLLVIQAILGSSSVVFALLLRSVIDAAAAGNRKAFFAAMGLLTGLVILQILLRAVLRRLEESARSSIENACKSRLFSVLLKKDYGSVTAVHSGEWMNRLTSDTVVCANGMVEILPGIAGMLVKMVGALVMILMLQPRFAYILFPGGAALLLLTYGFRKILKRLHKNVQEKDGLLRIFLQERLENLLIVRSFSAEENTRHTAEEKMADHKAMRMKRNGFSNFCNMGFAAAMNGMYLLGLGYCGYGITAGTISYGTLMAMLQLIGQIQAPFANITGYLPRFYAMTASADRLIEAENFPENRLYGVKTPEEIRKFYQHDFAAVGFSQMAFSYFRGEHITVLKNVHISIQKGEFAAITGHSGCGKSTLLKLLMCLYPLDSGEGFLRLQNGEKLPLTSQWHRLFAYVPQGNQLMNGSIRDVVAFGRPWEADQDQKLWHVLKIACAEEFVRELEQGLDYMLGERGQGLSEGQMQRIAVARAIFSDNPILLLDESTSALDGETEQRLLQNIRSMTDKTVLIVTHRPAALEICDTVIPMTEAVEEEENR